MWMLGAGLIGAIVSGLLTWKVQAWHYQADITTMQKDWQSQVDDANAKAQQNLDAAQLLGNQLATEQIKYQRKLEDGKNLRMKQVDKDEKANPAKCHFSADWVLKRNRAYLTDESSQTNTPR